MSTLMVPASAGDALQMLEAALGFLADADVTEMPTAVQAQCLAGLERPATGTIRLDGIDVLAAPRDAHRRVGFLQDFFGLSMRR